MNRAPLALLCLGALTLSACQQGSNQMASNGKICIDFKQAKPPLAASGTADSTALDTCVQRWAYALASSRDDAEVVADATVAACGAQLARWNQASLAQPNAESESASLMTGQPTTPLAEHNAFSHARALFYVVQARAGNCAAPPIVNGAPEGVS